MCLSVMRSIRPTHPCCPRVTCLPCVFPQAGQTPLECARYHNNPEVALLLTKAPQVRLNCILQTAQGLHSSWDSSAVTCQSQLKINESRWAEKPGSAESRTLYGTNGTQGTTLSLGCDLAAMSFLDPPFSAAQPEKFQPGSALFLTWK